MYQENRQPVEQSNIRIQFEMDAEGKHDMLRVSYLDCKDEIVRRVKPQDIERWPEQWALYERSKADFAKINGTPVSEIPMMSRQTAMALRLRGIQSVEQLAALDNYAANILDAEQGRQWRDAAAMFLAAQSLKNEKPKKAA